MFPLSQVGGVGATVVVEFGLVSQQLVLDVFWGGGVGASSG